MYNKRKTFTDSYFSNADHSRFHHLFISRHLDSIAMALTSQTFSISQHVHHGWQEEPSTAIAERCTRSRINSAIFVSSEGRGFDSIEFLRRHGSQSVLCRKARSAENITDEDRKVSHMRVSNFRTTKFN